MRRAIGGGLTQFIRRTGKLALSFALVASFSLAPIHPNNSNEAKAASGDRTLWVHFTHTGERKKITFRRNGKYDQAGLKELNWITRDWRRKEATKMDPRLFDLIWSVYQESGATQPIMIVSGYRSKKTNDALRRRSRGVAKSSQHSLGKAMDFYIPGVPIKKLREIGLKMQIGGVGYYPGSRSPFVHMDTGRVRHWPRVSPKQLARLFPDGKTLHRSTANKRLARYDDALREYQAQQNKIIQPLSRSKHSRTTVLAKADGDDASRGFLGGLFRNKQNNKDKKRIVDQAPETPAPVVVARKTKPSTPPLSVVPRKRPQQQPVLVANRLSEDDTTPIPSRIGRADPAPVRLAGIPIPRAVPDGYRTPEINDKAIVIAKADEVPVAPAINTDAPIVVASAIGTPSSPSNERSAVLSDPTKLVLKDTLKIEEPATNAQSQDLRLAYASGNDLSDNPAERLPEIDQQNVVGQDGQFAIANSALKAAMQRLARKRFGHDKPKQEKQPVNVASLNPNIVQGQDDYADLRRALQDRIFRRSQENLLTMRFEQAEKKRYAAAPATYLKKQALKQIRKTGLLTSPVANYTQLAKPKPAQMPELFTNPVQVYAGNFSHKGDQGTNSRFAGDALLPTPTLSFSTVQLSLLKN